jgi:hypothetical protein
MEDILPGVIHWTAVHPNHGQEVSSHWLPDAGAVVDPLLPDEGLDAFRERPPKVILLSNRHHLRHSEQIAAEFGAAIKCSAPGLHEFEDGPDVEGFEFGDEVAPGVQALEVGAICPDETGLLISPAGALLIADGLTHDGGELGFFPDRLLGDDPEGVKRGLRDSYLGLIDRDFDSLLFAHGEPVTSGGKELLREFCEAG